MPARISPRVGIIRHRIMNLCSKKNARSFPILECCADDLFTSAASAFELERLMSIDVGSIQIIDSLIQRLMNNSDGLLLILPAAKIHAAQAKLTDLDSCPSKIHIVHVFSWALALYP